MANYDGSDSSSIFNVSNPGNIFMTGMQNDTTTSNLTLQNQVVLPAIPFMRNIEVNKFIVNKLFGDLFFYEISASILLLWVF